MSEGPESLLVKKIKAAITGRYPDVFVTKLHGSAFSTAGMPDLLIVLRGHPVLLEVKAPRPGESDASVLSRVTPIQQARMKELRQAGASAEPCWSVDQALEIVARFVPESVTSEDRSRDIRLYALAADENRLRRRVEELEDEMHVLRAENAKLLKDAQ